MLTRSTRHPMACQGFQVPDGPPSRQRLGPAQPALVGDVTAPGEQEIGKLGLMDFRPFATGAVSILT